MAFSSRNITDQRLYDLLSPFFKGDVTGRYKGHWSDPYPFCNDPQYQIMA